MSFFDGIIFNPPIRPAYIVALAVALIALTVWNYVRARDTAGTFKSGALALLRIAAIIGIAIVLMRPMRDTAHAVPGQKSTFAVIVDASLSMDTTDMDGASRLDVALRRIADQRDLFVHDLGRNYELAFYTLGEGLQPIPFGQIVAGDFARADTTDLASSLMSLAAQADTRVVTGALLISDGRDNGGGAIMSAVDHLKFNKIPVWTTTVGGEGQTKDLFLTARFPQNFVFRGQETALNVNVNQTGYDGWYAKVTVYREGEAIDTQQALLQSGLLTLQFPMREEETGSVRYSATVEALAGEADSTNNERSAFIQVVDEKARVLFVEAEPYWDSKFLLRSLQADPNLDVTAIFHMSPTREKVFAVTSSASDSAPVRMPHTREELYQYDCVIFGRGADSLFDAEQLQLFKRYLEERGGGLIFARGRAYAARSEILAELEPVVWDDGALARARFELTPAGTVNPIFDFGDARPSNLIIRELPEMISVARVKDEKSLAVVLAKTTDAGGAELATIAYQRYGKGKVMSVASTGLWRWAFMRKELAHYDEVYARFWGQMIRWIVYGSDFLPGQDIAFRSDRNAYTPGETVPLVVQTKLIDTGEYKPRIVVRGPGGAETELTPAADTADGTLLSALFTPEKEGEYEATLYNNIGTPETETFPFNVYSDSIETRMVAADPTLMASIAEGTGAAVLGFDEWSELPQAVRTLESSTRRESKPVDVWDRYSVFTALIALLAVEWFIRRRTGLI